MKIAKKHTATCERLLEEQVIQTQALSLAVKNLQYHSNAILETFYEFNEHAQKEFKKHSALLTSFPNDLTTLSNIPIHNSIVGENRKLDDFVPKEKLYAWVKRCQIAHDHLVSKTSQLAESMEDIKIGCEQSTLEITGIDFPKLEELMENTRDVIHKLESRQQTLERDAARVESQCRELDQSEDKSEQKILAIEQLYKIHTTDYIPDITKCDRYIRETVLYFSDSKQHLTQVLKTKLQEISHYQSMIASLSPTISNLPNALNGQSEALLQLLHVHRMAPAWGATLVEIVRRKEYVRIFLQKAKEMADILSQFRAQEQRRRDTFKTEIARYLPQGLINGLEDSPPYCEISVSNTKDALPNLVLDDIIGI